MVLSLSPAIKHGVCVQGDPAARLPHTPIRARRVFASFLERDDDSLDEVKAASRRKSVFLSLKNVYETLYVSVPTVIDAVRGNVTREACDGRLGSWAERVVANSGMAIDVRGREHLEAARAHGGKGLVVMSNHQSHYDIAIIYYVVGSSVRMVAKRELFELPIFGRAIRAAGMIAVDRQNTESAIASLEDAKTKLADGIPMWIAPEGTRSSTGRLLPFKKGGFVLALGTGAPILPITIDGTGRVLPPSALRSSSGVEIVVTIHPAVDPTRFADLPPREARAAMAEEVRRVIESALPAHAR